MRLGRYGDAVEAFRYGREIDPRTPALYDLLAGAYAAQGEAQRVAATLLGKVLLLGPTPESLGANRQGVWRGILRHRPGRRVDETQ